MLLIKRSIVNTAVGANLFDSVVKTEVRDGACHNVISRSFANVDGSHNFSKDTSASDLSIGTQLLDMDDGFADPDNYDFRVKQTYADLNYLSAGRDGENIVAWNYYNDGVQPSATNVYEIRRAAAATPTEKTAMLSYIDQTCLPQSFWDRVDDDGTNIRISLDVNQVTILPIHVARFDKALKKVSIWFEYDDLSTKPKLFLSVGNQRPFPSDKDLSPSQIWDKFNFSFLFNESAENSNMFGTATSDGLLSQPNNWSQISTRIDSPVGYGVLVKNYTIDGGTDQTPIVLERGSYGYLHDSFNEMQFSCWLSIDKDANNGPLVLYEEGGSTNGYALIYRTNEQMLSYCMWNDQNLVELVCPVVLPTNDPTWYMATIAFKDSVMYFYLNGVEQSQVAFTSTNLQPHSDYASFFNTTGTLPALWPSDGAGWSGNAAGAIRQQTVDFEAIPYRYANQSSPSTFWDVTAISESSNGDGGEMKDVSAGIFASGVLYGDFSKYKSGLAGVGTTGAILANQTGHKSKEYTVGVESIASSDIVGQKAKNQPINLVGESYVDFDAMKTSSSFVIASSNIAGDIDGLKTTSQSIGVTSTAYSTYQYFKTSGSAADVIGHASMEYTYSNIYVRYINLLISGIGSGDVGGSKSANNAIGIQGIAQQYMSYEKAAQAIADAVQSVYVDWEHYKNALDSITTSSMSSGAIEGEKAFNYAVNSSLVANSEIVGEKGNSKSIDVLSEMMAGIDAFKGTSDAISVSAQNASYVSGIKGTSFEADVTSTLSTPFTFFVGDIKTYSQTYRMNGLLIKTQLIGTLKGRSRIDGKLTKTRIKGLWKGVIEDVQ